MVVSWSARVSQKTQKRPDFRVSTLKGVPNVYQIILSAHSGHYTEVFYDSPVWGLRLMLKNTKLSQAKVVTILRYYDSPVTNAQKHKAFVHIKGGSTCTPNLPLGQSGRYIEVFYDSPLCGGLRLMLKNTKLSV